MAQLKLPRVKRYKKQMSRYASADMKHDRSLLPFSAAKSTYNFDFSSGVLRKGYGVRSSSYVPTEAARYWVYRFYSEEKGEYVDQYIFQYSNGMIAFHDEEENANWYITGKAFKPLDALNYRLNSTDVLLLSCEGHKLLTWNGRNLVEHTESPNISSMAVHYERLFVTDRNERNRVYFSKNLDPTQWDIGVDGGGFIELLDERGYLNKVVSFGSYLYIFRDHGISRVTAYGDQREFAVVNLFVTAGRIYPSSITTCGNCIMFLASDGLYVFDGYECKRTLDNISAAILPDDNCAAAYFNGKYYLACRMDFKDSSTIGCESSGTYKTNALVVYDPSSGEYTLSRGLDISYISACSYNGNDYLMCVEGGRGGVLQMGASRFNSSLYGYWESAETTMDEPNKMKYLTDIVFYNDDNGSDNDLFLNVRVDGVNHELRLRNRKMYSLRFNLHGYKFVFAIRSKYEKLNITPLYIKYGVY